MALEDLAMMRAVHGSTVLYPSDPNQTAQLVARMADQAGISYLRTTREKTPVLYPPTERFTIGGSTVVRQSDADAVTIVAAGITLHEALKAHDDLLSAGVPSRVIDAYSVKPIDRETLWAAARVTKGRIVIAEDHWPEGGLGSAVAEAFTATAGWREELPIHIQHLAVRSMPGSGTPAQLLAGAGIDSAAIVKTALQVVGR
jgi:transketolase